MPPAARKKAAAKRDERQMEFVSIVTYATVPDVQTGGWKVIPQKSLKPMMELTTRQFATLVWPVGTRIGPSHIKRVCAWIDSGEILEEERRKIGPTHWRISAAAYNRLREKWATTEFPV